MKTNIAIVGDNGHFHNEIDLPGSEGLEGIHENIQLQRTFSSSPSAMVLSCRLRTYQIDVYLSRFSLILFRQWLLVDFSGTGLQDIVFVFPSVYVSYLKVNLGSRGCSWLASPDEYRLCITSFRIFSVTSSLGSFRFLLTFDMRLFLVSNCFRTRRSACRDSGYITASVYGALRGPTASTVHASTLPL